MYATTFSEGSHSIMQCICPQGYSGTPFLGGECNLCSTNPGLSCPANSSLPYINAGHCRDPENNQTVLQCIPSNACEASGFSLTANCTAGYTGSTCGSCLSGTHYRQGLVCKGCPSSVFKWIGAVVLILVVVYVVERALSKPSASLPADVTIALGGVQLLALLPSISSNWPKVLSGLLNTLALTNLDIDLFAPECSVPMTFWDKYLIKMFSPLIFIAVVIVVMLTKLVWAKIFKTSAAFSTKFASLKNRVISLFITGISSLYILLTSGALSPFVCTKNLNGTFSLTRSPNISCYEGEWMNMLPLIVIFLLIYVIIFPISIIGLLLFNRSQLRSQDFTQRYGHLVRDYRISYCFWEIVVLLRRVSTSAFVQFVSSKYDNFGTTFFAVFTLSTFVLLDVICFPYNRLQYMTQSIMWSTLLSISILANSLVFNNQTVAETTKGFVEILLVILICFSLLWLISQVMRITLKSLQNQFQNQRPETAYIDSGYIYLNTPIAIPLDAKSLDQILIFPQTHFDDILCVCK
jgi:hypothetical protein